MAAKKFLTGIDVASQKIVNLADGSAASDAATYGQLLNLVNGLDFKDGVAAASTANVTISSPGATIDGVALASGDRVLLKDQTTASENGIYVFNGATSALTRAADATADLLTQGATVVVAEGTVGGGTQWTLTTKDPITVGTTALSFTKTSGGGATYTAGNGIDITAGVISAKTVAGGGLQADSTGLSVDPTKVVRKFAAAVGDGSATSIAVVHSLGTRDVTVALYDAASYEEVETDVTHTDANTVTLTFAAAPASGKYRVVVHG